MTDFVVFVIVGRCSAGQALHLGRVSQRHQAAARGRALPHRHLHPAQEHRHHPGVEQADDGGASQEDLRESSKAGAG